MLYKAAMLFSTLLGSVGVCALAASQFVKVQQMAHVKFVVETEEGQVLAVVNAKVDLP